jgi:hypothetical protein
MGEAEARAERVIDQDKTIKYIGVGLPSVPQDLGPKPNAILRGAREENSTGLTKGEGALREQ